MLSLFRRLKPYTWSIVLTLVLVLVQAISELGLPTLMAGIIDKGVLGKNQNAVISGGMWMFSVAALSALASVAAAWVSAGLAAGYGRDLRSAIFRKSTTLSVDQFTVFGAASLITRTTNDVTQVQSFVIMSLRMLASAPLMAIGGIVLAFSLDPGLALVLLFAVPVLGVVIFFLARRGVTYFRLVQEKIDRLNLVLRETLTGVRVIRAFDRQEFDARRFDRANLDLAGISLKTQKLMAVVMPGMMFAMSLTSILLVWFGAVRIQSGTLTVGGLMAFLQYATQILFSLMMLSMLFVLLPRAAVSAGRINEVLTLAENPDDLGATSGRRTDASGAEIEFRDVSFRYPGAETAALDHVSFTVPAGKTTALIGSTGAGKTTLLQLICRFHDATSGIVLVDGLDVKAWSRDALRRRLGVSPQRARLFTGTVAENLRWGDPNASDEQLFSVLETAQATEFVHAMDGGLAGHIDQAGVNLSGGQKQRLSIARALIRRPAILLFDDSFSALDARTDAELRAQLRLKAGATVLLVAQRVSSVRQADRIIVVDEGRIEGVGTHSELVADCPVYREIVVSQESLEDRV